MSQARIETAFITAGHDGAAELVVRLRYQGGGRHDVVLDEPAAQALMEACGANTVDDLKGQGWEYVRDALTKAWNRCTPGSS